MSAVQTHASKECSCHKCSIKAATVLSTGLKATGSVRSLNTPKLRPHDGPAAAAAGNQPVVGLASMTVTGLSEGESWVEGHLYPIAAVATRRGAPYSFVMPDNATSVPAVPAVHAAGGPVVNRLQVLVPISLPEQMDLLEELQRRDASSYSSSSPPLAAGSEATAAAATHVAASGSTTAEAPRPSICQVSLKDAVSRSHQVSTTDAVAGSSSRASKVRDDDQDSLGSKLAWQEWKQMKQGSKAGLLVAGKPGAKQNTISTMQYQQAAG